MKKRIFLASIVFFLLTNCGFTVLHQSVNNIDFEIEKISYKGDTSLNNYFSTIFERYKKNKETEKKFQIKSETIYKKNIYSKDKAGNPLEYEIIIESIFKIYKNETFIKSYKYLERFKLKNEDDEFQEKDNERIIRQNYASLISNKLITQLLLLK